jgi:O-antigen ligase
VPNRIFPITPRAFIQAFIRQPPAFCLLCLYIMVEYVRPQSVWPAIDFLPWGLGSILLAFVAYMLKTERGARQFTVVDGTLVAFSAVLFLSSLTSTHRDWSIAGWEFYVNWLLVYVLIAGVVTNPKRYFVFLVLFLLWSLKMSQHASRTFAERGFSFANWGATGAPGWFENSGEFAIQMCVFLPMSYYLMVGVRDRIRPWLYWMGQAVMPGTAIVGLIASSSRGGQLGGAIVIAFMIAQGKHRVRALVGAIIVIGGVWMFMPEQQKARFSEMGDDSTSQSRLTYWKDGLEIMKEHPVLGIGYEAWEPYYHQYYNPHGELPHNIFIEAGSELGYTGLFAFIAMIIATLVLNRRTRKLSARVHEWGGFLRYSALGLDGALLGYLVSGFFVTVLYYPYFWVNLGGTAALFETTRRAAARPASAVRGGSSILQRGHPDVVNQN